MSDALELSALRVALIGYGEVGGILGRALSAQGLGALRTYDRLLDDPERRDAMRQRAVDDGVEPAATAVAAANDAGLIVSAVTAAEAYAAAQSVAATAAMRPGAFYVDLNSASPRTKCECAERVNAAGGRYVEMAVMTSFPPQGIQTPMLSGGPHAAAAAPLLAALGFRVEPASERYGVASAIKMCRSVVIKGMEAIVIESFLTARRYGVERQVLASLAETYPGLDWEKCGDYFFQRVIQHGRRRAEEMREAAITVREMGLESLMATAAADRQAWVAALALEGTFAGSPADAGWRALADRIP
jgi:3-hydroxyisobutyrate dehydrogenase-like beta-hydroxyacid dehydrogenase